MKKHFSFIACFLISTPLLTAQTNTLTISRKTWDRTDQLQRTGPIHNHVFIITKDSVSNDIYVNDSLVSRNVIKNEQGSFNRDILKYDVFFWEDFDYQSRIETKHCDTLTFGIVIRYSKDLVTKEFYITHGCTLLKYYPLFNQLFDLFEEDKKTVGHQ